VHYAAGKGAIEAMTRGMAIALAPYNINVNCVAPGTVLTPTVKNMFKDPRNANPVIERTPGNKVTEIEDCIGLVLFFCTDAARMIRGQIVDIDGGYSIHGMEWVISEEMATFRKELESKGYEKK
jgi:NAD(P)-dependent dehydrogenase (short-subunit alcohol dehydrogenase family)